MTRLAAKEWLYICETAEVWVWWFRYGLLYASFAIGIAKNVLYKMQNLSLSHKRQNSRAKAPIKGLYTHPTWLYRTIYLCKHFTMNIYRNEWTVYAHIKPFYRLFFWITLIHKRYTYSVTFIWCWHIRIMRSLWVSLYVYSSSSLQWDESKSYTTSKPYYYHRHHHNAYQW